MVINVAYSSRKGFFVPKTEQWVNRPGLKSGSIIKTNGFDQYKWDNSNDNEEEGEDYDGKESDSIYNDDIKHVTYESNLSINDDYISKVSVSLDDADENNSETSSSNESKHKGSKRKKEKGKKATAKKEAKSKVNQFKYKNKSRNKNNDYEADFIDGNDVSKINILKKFASRVNKSFPNDNDRLLQFYDITIYKGDIEALQDDNWLNDNNISFTYEFLERYMLNKFFNKLCQTTHNPNLSNSIILLKPSLTYLLQHIDDSESLWGVLPELHASNFIFLPVNDNDDVELAEGGSHWSLILISLLDRKALIFDSLKSSNVEESEKIINNLSTYLNSSKNEGSGSKKYKFEIIEMDTPQQINGSDCGILVSQITAFLLSRLITSEDDSIVDLSLNRVEISAIDGRIFILGFIVHLLELKGLLDT